MTTPNEPWKEDPTEGGCLKEGAKKVWKFVHHEDFRYETALLKGRNFEGKWLVIDDGLIIVKGSRDNNRGYAWDGCTPKFNLFHITWGNFDGKLINHSDSDYKPFTYYGSMVHDVLYQYKRCAPVTRAEADKIFYHLLKKSGFMWAWLFYAGVRAFGWIFSGWRYKK